MPPLMAEFNSIDRSQMNSESSCDISVCHRSAVGKFFNCANLVFGQFRVRIIRSSAIGRPSAFANHVVNVVLDCANEQMIRPNARRVIALMEHLHSIRNWSVVKCPREAVRATIPVLNGELSITRTAAACCPFPAALAEFHVFPKPI